MNPEYLPLLYTAIISFVIFFIYAIFRNIKKYNNRKYGTVEIFKLDVDSITIISYYNNLRITHTHWNEIDHLKCNINNHLKEQFLEIYKRRVKDDNYNISELKIKHNNNYEYNYTTVICKIDNCVIFYKKYLKNKYTIGELNDKCRERYNKILKECEYIDKPKEELLKIKKKEIIKDERLDKDDFIAVYKRAIIKYHSSLLNYFDPKVCYINGSFMGTSKKTLEDEFKIIDKIANEMFIIGTNRERGRSDKYYYRERNEGNWKDEWLVKLKFRPIFHGACLGCKMQDRFSIGICNRCTIFNWHKSNGKTQYDFSYKNEDIQKFCINHDRLNNKNNFEEWKQINLRSRQRKYDVECYRR